MRTLPLEQGTSEWHAWRRTRRQASYSPAVMGASAYQSRRDVLTFYRDGKSGFTGNTATDYGHRHEPDARAYAAGIVGELLSPVCVENAEYGASLDGITDDGQTIVECKCPYRGRESPIYANIARYQSPGGYAWQVQHQLMVSGAARALYVVWTPDAPLHLWIEPDAAKQDELRAAWNTLWDELIAGKGAERDDEAWLTAVARYRSAKRDADAAEKALIEARSGLTDIASCDCETGGGLRVQKIERKGQVDYAKVPELTGVDLEPYRKPPGSRWRVEEVKA